ncbi:AAA family ATPase [uncultured Salinisphaera sp.]|uniref:AAA family ATPase n=1 Tax=uncultured Salinisphaera sp. TaxID=359372 RepID=UPI0032B2CD6A|tara:strand:+ start:4552 stop:5076 length:525 start_codon:yes stop_codon:yes gene_type:complete
MRNAFGLQLLVTGAAGAGTSSLARALADALGLDWQEADDIHWHDTDPPFQQKRDRVERARMMADLLAAYPRLVVAGSIDGWGHDVESAFDAIVFLSAPTDVRLARLREREVARHGRADPGFMAWAAQYESGALPGRSRARHEAWLASRTCPVIRLRSTEPVLQLVEQVRDAVTG